MLEDEYRPTLQQACESIAKQGSNRKKLRRLRAIGASEIRSLWASLSNSVIRAGFYSVLQAVEMLLLMRVHFLYVPASSFGVLAVLSVLHTAGMALALTLKERTHELEDHFGGKRAAAEQLIWSAVISFLFLSLLLGLVYTFATKSHFQAPPIYRAMVMGWIISLPLEIAITLGFYSLTLRGVLIVNQKLIRLQLLQAGTGCFGILLNSPLLYLGSRILFLLFTWSILFPSRFRGHLSPDAPFLKHGSSRQENARVFWSFLRSGIGPACLELSGKILYIPFLHLDPALSLNVLILQRLLHTASAVSLRVATMQARPVTRMLALGNAGSRFRLFNRLLFVTASGLLLLVVFLPLFVIRSGIRVWTSPYGEAVELSSFLIGGMFAVGILRALLLAALFALEESIRKIGARSFWIAPLGWSGGILLALACAFGPVAQVFSFQVLPQIAGAVLLVECGTLLILLFSAGCLYLRIDAARWSKRGLLPILAASEIEMLGFEKQAPSVFERLPDRTSKEIRVHRWSRTTFLFSGRASVPSELFPFLERKDSFSGRSSSELTGALMNYSGYRHIPPGSNPEILRILETCKNVSGSVEIFSWGTRQEFEMKVVPVDLILLGAELDRQENLEHYLDLLVVNGSILVAPRTDSRLKGIVHLNRGSVPTHLLVVEGRSRGAMIELLYETLLYNLGQAQLAFSDVALDSEIRQAEKSDDTVAARGHVVAPDPVSSLS